MVGPCTPPLASCQGSYVPITRVSVMDRLVPAAHKSNMPFPQKVLRNCCVRNQYSKSVPDILLKV